MVTNREAILDPTGQSDGPRATTLSPRVRDLAGVRLGLLDNAKPNAALVLETVAAQLRAQHHLGEVSTYTKSYFGTPVEEDRAKEIAQRATVPEQLGLDLADTVRRTGALIHETISACIALGPEHAGLLAGAGWSKNDLRRFIYEHAFNHREALAAVGKDAVSGKTRWRLSSAHPDAIPDSAAEHGLGDEVRVLNSEQAVQIVVAGAQNAGVSAVIETFGPRGERPAIAGVEAAPASR